MIKLKKFNSVKSKMIIETFEAIKEIKVFQKEKIVSNLFNSKVDVFEKNMFFDKGSATWLSIKNDPAWAIISKDKTPGITGWPGKWPWKKGSFIVKFFKAIKDSPCSIISILSIKINGYLWGKIFIISFISNFVWFLIIFY